MATRKRGSAVLRGESGDETDGGSSLRSFDGRRYSCTSTWCLIDKRDSTSIHSLFHSNHTRISLVSLTHTALENQRLNVHLIMVNTKLALRAQTQVPIKRQRLTDEFDVGFLGESASDVPSEPFRKYAQETGSDRKGRDLSALFEPPHKLLFRGSFDQLMRVANQKKKLVLVNIQSTTDFDSHKLNRDTWKDETIEEIIQESFLFWQQDRTSSCVQRYLSMYKIMTFPHIGILDFRTGEMVWNRTGFQSYDDLTSALFSIIEKYGEDEEEEDEKKSDEMVQATPVTTPVPSPKRTTTTASSSSSVMKEVEKEEEEEVMKTPLPSVKPEPEIGISPSVTSIQFKFSDGNRIARRFMKEQTVQEVYDFVSSKRQIPESKFELRLSYPPKPLTSMKSKTIEEASLMRSLVFVKSL